MSYSEFTELLRHDMAVSFGVTEPGAIALAVSKARAFTQGEIEKIILSMNSGIYKNSFTCGIPGTDKTGIQYAAALGAVAGDWEKGLEALSVITDENIAEADRLIAENRVEVVLDSISSDLFIKAGVKTFSDYAEVIIRHMHTNITDIIANGKVVFHKENEAESAESAHTGGIGSHSFAEMLDYAVNVPLEEISFIKRAYEVNLELAAEGVSSDICAISRRFIKENGGRIFSDDLQKSAHALTASAIEARVRGLAKPAMSITGSGNHGIISTMPLYACCKIRNLGEETLLRATALSYLVTEYIKEYSGKLSAYCGCAIAAGTGSAVGICYMLGGTENMMRAVINNMASSITGVICTGGNPACVLKAAIAIDIGFKSVELAMDGIAVETMHGINGLDTETTMKNIGLIASPGMEQTEGTIVDILAAKSGNGTK